MSVTHLLSAMCVPGPVLALEAQGCLRSTLPLRGSQSGGLDGPEEDTSQENMLCAFPEICTLVVWPACPEVPSAVVRPRWSISCSKAFPLGQGLNSPSSQEIKYTEEIQWMGPEPHSGTRTIICSSCPHLWFSDKKSDQHHSKCSLIAPGIGPWWLDCDDYS